MHFVRILAAACWLLGPALSLAQPGAPAANPLDPAASVPPLPALNVLAGYVPFQAQPIAPWRQSNDQVAPAAGNPPMGMPMSMPAPAGTPDASGKPGQAGGARPEAGAGHAHHH